MQSIQQLFNEPSDTGIQQPALRLLGRLRRRRQQPGRHRVAHAALAAGATRSPRASTRSATQLTQQRHEHDQPARRDRRRRSTSTARSIAQLNQAIKAGTISGLPVNDLMDQRDLLANKLAEAERRRRCAPTDFNQVNVMLGGTTLVQDDQAQHLHASTRRAPTVGAALGERQRGRDGHVGQGRRQAQRDQHDDPGLPREARRRRDDSCATR